MNGGELMRWRQRHFWLCLVVGALVVLALARLWPRPSLPTPAGALPRSKLGLPVDTITAPHLWMPTIRIPSATEFVVLRQTYDAAELDDYSALMAKYLAEGDYLVLSLPQELPRADFEWALDALITTFGSPMTCWLLALGPEPARAVVTTASGHTFPANARLIGVELVRPNDAPEGDCLSTNERTTVTELVRAIEAAVGTARLAIPATRHPR